MTRHPDPLSPQWEDCKVCGGDHWTKDHPDLRLPPDKQGPMPPDRRDELNAEAERLQTALKDAYQTMDAACRWAATQTGGLRTIEDADRHMAGYDALLNGAVRAGLAAGILRR